MHQKFGAKELKNEIFGKNERGLLTNFNSGWHSAKYEKCNYSVAVPLKAALKSSQVMDLYAFVPI